MIGVDTNILVRYVLDDDPIWSPIAADFIEHTLSRDNVGFINVVTLAELVWALKKSRGFDREGLAIIIESFLNSEKLMISEPDIVERALDLFRNGNADFADYLIAELNGARGARPTMTIDKKAARNEAFLPLDPGA